MLLQRRGKRFGWFRVRSRPQDASHDPATAKRTVRTAPWASDRALRRLAEVEDALPADPAAAFAAATDAVLAHERRVEQDALLLYAGGNVPTALSASTHHPLLSNQPSMGYAGDKFQAGLEALDVLEVTVSRLVADVMGARYAEVRPTSATLANLAVYAALALPGDTIAVLPGWAGGHLSHHEIGAPGIRGVRVVELPYDLHVLDVDLDRVADVPCRRAAQACGRRREPDAAPAPRSRRWPTASTPPARPCSTTPHTSPGLVAEGRFQTPLAEGADVMTFSTYKSFGGPAGGAIVSDDAELMRRISAAVYPGLTANYDIARLLPLGAAGSSIAARTAPTPTRASTSPSRSRTRSRRKGSMS